MRRKAFSYTTRNITPAENPVLSKIETVSFPAGWLSALDNLSEDGEIKATQVADVNERPCLEGTDFSIDISL